VFYVDAGDRLRGFGWLLLRPGTTASMGLADDGAVGALWVIFRADLRPARFEIGYGEAVYFCRGHLSCALIRRWFVNLNRRGAAFVFTLGTLIAGAGCCFVSLARMCWGPTDCAARASVWINDHICRGPRLFCYLRVAGNLRPCGCRRPKVIGLYLS